MSRYRKLTTVAAVAALGFGLAACGGGGSDSDDTASTPAVTDPPAPQPEAVMSTVALTQAQQDAFLAVLAMSGGSDSVTIPAGGSVERAEVTLTCDSDYPCTVTVTNNLGTIVATMSSQALPDADAPMVTASGAPVPGGTVAAIQRRARALGGNLSRWTMEDADNDPATPDVPVHADQDRSRMPAYLDTMDDADTANVIENTLLDRIKPDGIDHDGDKDTALIPADPHSRGIAEGWMGATFRQDLSGGAADWTVVFTDKEADASESFAEAYGRLGGVNAADTLGVGAPDLDDGTTGIQTPDNSSTTPEQREQYAKDYAKYVATVRTFDFVGKTKPGSGRYNGAPTITGDDDEAAQIASRAQFWMLASSPDGFPAKPPSGTDTSRDYFGPGDDPANAGKQPTDDDYNANGEKVMGTFDGVTGYFECLNDAGCTVRHSASMGLSSHDQATTSTVAEWQFVAASSTSTVATTRPDGDFVKIGWWRHVPDFSSGTHRFATFYTGRDPFMASSVQALEGKATYKGPAVGMYVSRRGGGSLAAIEGRFTALATLEADFGGDLTDDTADSTDWGMISGKVTDFVAHTGLADLGDWQVTLGEASLEEGGNFVGTFSGDTADDENSRANGRHFDTGGWEGQFYGNGGTTNTSYPGTVAGQFDARWGTAQPPGAGNPDSGFVGVAGIFGADYQEPPEDE